VIPYGHQDIDDEDIAAVTAVLKGDWLTQGPAVEAFEDALVAATGARFAVAFANGTAALHAAAATAGLGPGDLVTTSALTFVASANCARFVGASVQLLDIDPDSLNVDPATVPECDAFIAVHMAGLPLDLRRFARRPRVVIEDAAHALGAMTPDGPVGGCAHSDMCTFSFHPVKAVTTGEGGAVTTNDPQLAGALRRFRSHDITRRPDDPPWRYDVAGLGFNYRLSDIHAALGASQLTKLERFIARRNQMADRYRAGLASAPLTFPVVAPPGYRHAYHLFQVRVARRDEVIARLRSAGIGAQVHYVPVHHLSAFASEAHHLPHADRAGAEVLSLPMFPSLRDDEQDTVIEAVTRVLGATDG
jgi:perosamine synthetase